jgi:hypothetical protein
LNRETMSVIDIGDSDGDPGSAELRRAQLVRNDHGDKPLAQGAVLP